MKPAFMQTVTIETALLALAFPGAQAQKASSDLITLQIEDLMNVNGHFLTPDHRSGKADLTVLPSLGRRSAYARLTWRF
jgi:hypothetical protein